MNSSTRFLQTLAAIMTRAGRLRTVFGLMLLALALSTSTAHAQVYNQNTLYSFTGGTDESYPYGVLVNVNGLFYGTTSGTAFQSTYGTIFSFDPSSNTLTTLYTFKGTANNNTDGANPFAGLTYDSTTGKLYGTTISGGTTGAGTVFSFDPSTHKETILYNVGGSTGIYPSTTLLDVNGKLYGTTQGGGSGNEGTVFAINTNGTEFQVVYSFAGGTTDGSTPYGDLTYDSSSGKLYGTTAEGGSPSSTSFPGGIGTIFSIDLSTNTETLLYSFKGSATGDGAVPQAGLIEVNGIFYGTTAYGGSHTQSTAPNGFGTVFSYNPSTNTETTLYSFQGTSSGNAFGDGASPESDLINVGGKLYGTTAEGGDGTVYYNGGNSGLGTVFSFDPSNNTETILSSGRGSNSGLLDFNGTLYGNTLTGSYGAIFSLTPFTATTPVASNDTYTTKYLTKLTVAAPGVLANDNGGGSNRPMAKLVTSTTNGTLTFTNNGSFVYTPNKDFAGTDTFTYQIANQVYTGNTVTVTITVQPGLPVAKNDAATISYNTSRTNAAPGVLANDDNSGGGTMTAALVTNVTHGTLTLSSNGSFTYIPNTGYLGDDQFTYQAVTSVGKSNTAYVYLTVAATVPNAHNDACTISYNRARTNAAPGVLGNDSDGGSSPLTATLVSNVTHGTLTLNSDGSFTYTPNTGYAGTDTFTYQAVNSIGKSNVATVTLTVVASTPTAHNDACTVVYNKARTNAAPGVLGNDDNGGEGPLTATLVSNVTHGTLTLNSDGSFTYTPNTGYVGTDSFTYQVSNPVGKGTIGTVTLTVIPTTPTARNDGATILHNTGRFFAAPGVLSNDDDGGAGSMTSTLVQTTQHGTVSLGSDGSFTYTPFTGYSGTDTFTYQVANSVGTGNIATVTLTVQ